MPFDELPKSAKRQDSSDGTEAVPQGNEMKKNEIIDRSRKLAERYCVTNSKKFRLKDIDPDDTGEATPEDKPRAKELLETGVQTLAELQDVLYAQDRWSVLLIFQAMDAPAGQPRWPLPRLQKVEIDSANGESAGRNWFFSYPGLLHRKTVFRVIASKNF